MTPTKCEACGLVVGIAEYVFVRTTNGSLDLCQQCRDDINRKNPATPTREKITAAVDRLGVASGSCEIFIETIGESTPRGERARAAVVDLLCRELLGVADADR